MSQYSLKPENGSVEKGKITKAEVAEHYRQYLSITIDYDSYGTQGYPACGLKDINEGVDSFKSFLSIESLEQAKDKEVYVILDRGMIFALYNPESREFFCLQAEFFPESYSDALKEILIKHPDINISHLDPTEGLIVTYLMAMPVKDEISAQMQSIAYNRIFFTEAQNQYQQLSQKIPDKEEVKDIKINKKKI